MNKKIIFILILGLLILPLISLAKENQWQFAGDTGLPYRLRSFAIYNNKLYVSQDVGNVYRYDGGINWTNVGPIPDHNAVNSLVVWNNQLYAGDYAFGGWLLRYAGGNKWQRLAHLPYCGILSLTVFDNQIYAGSEDCLGQNGSRIYRYNAIQNQWQEVGFLPEMFFVISLVNHQNKLYASGLGGHVYRYDGGTNWTDLGRVGNGGGTYGLVSYQNQLYTGTERGCLYRYDSDPDEVDKGRWTEVGCLPDAIYTLAVYKNKLYAGTTLNGHVWRWDNGTWADTGMAGQGCCYNTVHSLIEYNGWLWAGKVDGRIFKYRDWSNQSIPIK
jgi:hypothetical protein